jgi:hypothetical protein
MPEKDYSYGEQLLLEAVKSTYGIPTMGLLVAGFAGFKFLAPKVEWFLKSSEDVAEEIVGAAERFYEDAILRGLKPLKQGVIVPVTTFTDDAKACYESSKINVPVLGRIWVPAVSSTQFYTCMGAKGYLGETIERYASFLQ